MADPARMKTEVAPERTASADEEHPKSEENENVPATEKNADDVKESSSEDQSKQELKPVSTGCCFHYIRRESGLHWLLLITLGLYH